MIPKSNEIRFETTTNCNYNCVICPRSSITRPKGTMNCDLFKNLLDKILVETDQYKMLTIAGMGEGLLDSTISDKIRYAIKKSLKLLILTNGSMLSLDKFRELESIGVSSIRVSFHGQNKRSYVQVHGVAEELYDKVKDNLTEICRIKSTTQVLLTYNVVKNVNESDLGSWINYWKDKADLLEVWRPHNWTDGKSYRKIQKERKKTCGRPWTTPLQVQVDGTVNMCCFDYDGQLLLGDLKTQPLKEIFESEMFNKIKDCHKSGNFENSGLVCECCDQLNCDKSEAMIYNSKCDIQERIKQFSTNFLDIECYGG